MFVRAVTVQQLEPQPHTVEQPAGVFVVRAGMLIAFPSASVADAVGALAL